MEELTGVKISKELKPCKALAHSLLPACVHQWMTNAARERGGRCDADAAENEAALLGAFAILRHQPRQQ